MSVPWYRPCGDEVAAFEAAYRARLPVLLRGPTGCGKTRFVEHMAARLSPHSDADARLVTVACHDDLSAGDLVGRYLLSHDSTVWLDGPLTRAVRGGAICYLDEVVEARRDTTVVIHALTDHRRMLPIEKTGETLRAHPDFLLVVSYNPGQQSRLKALKASTRQRFVALEFSYPSVAIEAEIVAHESGVDAEMAQRLAEIAARLRHLESEGLHDGVSTRLLVHAATLMVQGLAPRRACELAITLAATDDAQLRQAIANVIDLLLPRA
jgi:nitric oxide reductase NorQ protein